MKEVVKLRLAEQKDYSRLYEIALQSPYTKDFVGLSQRWGWVGEVWVAEVEKEVVGFVYFNLPQRRDYLNSYWTAVHPNWKGKGIGTRFLDLQIQRAHEARKERIVFRVAKKNVESQTFYAGFEITPTGEDKKDYLYEILLDRGIASLADLLQRKKKPVYTFRKPVVIVMGREDKGKLEDVWDEGGVVEWRGNNLEQKLRELETNLSRLWRTVVIVSTKVALLRELQQRSNVGEWTSCWGAQSDQEVDEILNGALGGYTFVTFWGAHGEGKSTIPHQLIERDYPTESPDGLYTYLPLYGVELLGRYRSQCGGADAICGEKVVKVVERWIASPARVVMAEGVFAQIPKAVRGYRDAAYLTWRLPVVFSFGLTLEEVSDRLYHRSAKRLEDYSRGGHHIIQKKRGVERLVRGVREGEFPWMAHTELNPREGIKATWERFLEIMGVERCVE